MSSAPKYDGSPCGRCGLTLRYDSGACINCQKYSSKLRNGTAKRKEYMKDYGQRDYVKEYDRIRNKTPERLKKHRERSRKPEVKERNKFSIIHRTYGLSKEQYTKLMKIQDEKCAICRNVFDSTNRNTTAQVDHNHKTRKTRELLCGPCNRMIENAKEKISVLASAIEYLRKHNG